MGQRARRREAGGGWKAGSSLLAHSLTVAAWVHGASHLPARARQVENLEILLVEKEEKKQGINLSPHMCLPWPGPHGGDERDPAVGREPRLLVM